MTIDEMITVLQAAKEGKFIQCREKTDDDSGFWAEACVWNFNHYDYRVKPEPMEIEIWVLENGKYTEIAREHHSPSEFREWAKKKFREVIE